MFDKGDKVKIPDGRFGIVEDIVMKKGPVGYPYQELHIRVEGDLVAVVHWKVVDATVYEKKTEEPEQVAKKRGRKSNSDI